MPIHRDPVSTGGSGGWTPTGAATLHEAVTDPSDAVFITCADGSACTLALDAAENPNDPSGTQVVVRVFKAVDIGQVCDVLVELMDGLVVIEDWTLSDIEDTPTDHALDVPLASGDTIANWPSLSVRITDAASPGTATVNVARAYLAVPDVTLRVQCTSG